jgi:exopolysaccharide biosynthesis polyprenyl glycosylphosphotransferase
VAVGYVTELQIHDLDGPSLAGADGATLRLTPALADPIPRRRRSWLVWLALVIADICAVAASYALVRTVGGEAASGAIPVVALLLWLFAFYSARLYERDDAINHATLDEWPALALAVTVGAWLYVVTMSIVGEVDLPFVIGWWLALVLTVPVMRVAARSLVRRDPAFPQNTVIVGAGSVGQLLGRKILQHPEYNLNLFGFVDALPMERRDDLEQLTLLGSPDDLPDLVERLCLERVIIAFSNDSHQQTMSLIRVLKDLDVRVDIVPRLFDVIPPRLTSHTIEGLPLISLPRLRLSRSAVLLKRSFDVLVAGIGLILLGPMFLLTTLLVKLDSPGPVFFRQERIGNDDRRFSIFKFRTMVIDAEERKPEVAHLNQHARAGGDPRMFKVVDDPRVTRVGRVLRAYSLDEFPQLFNVLKGEMSLIGPRPLIPEEDQHVAEWGRKRLALKPGMTGLWQVSGRSAIPFEEMVKLDYLYVTTWSLAGDCRLLLQTVPLVFRADRNTH